jgi:hypothetical protein
LLHFKRSAPLLSSPNNQAGILQFGHLDQPASILVHFVAFDFPDTRERPKVDIGWNVNVFKLCGERLFFGNELIHEHFDFLERLAEWNGLVFEIHNGTIVFAVQLEALTDKKNVNVCRGEWLISIPTRLNRNSFFSCASTDFLANARP